MGVAVRSPVLVDDGDGDGGELALGTNVRVTFPLGDADCDGAPLLGATLLVTTTLGANDGDGDSGRASLGETVLVFGRLGDEDGNGAPSLGVTVRLGVALGPKVGREDSRLGPTVGTNIPVGDIEPVGTVGGLLPVPVAEGAKVGPEVSPSLPLGDGVPTGARDWVTRPVGVEVGRTENWSLSVGGAVPSVPPVGDAELVGTRVLPVGTGVADCLPVGKEVLSISPDGATEGCVLALGASVLVVLPVGTGVS